jgi:hypothetical protein
MKRTWLSLALLLLAVAPALGQEQQDAKYLELLRADLKTQKTAIMTENLHLSDEEGAKFWPIYREYDLKLSTLQDERLSLLKDYATAYENIGPEMAMTLMNKALDLEEKRLKLRRQYFGKIAKEVSPVVAARFVHVDSVIQHALDLEIQMQVPMMVGAKPAEQKPAEQKQ